MPEIYEKFKDAIIQIATPWGTGTGFFLHEYNLIVTNRHVTNDAKEVVISGRNFPKTISRLMFSDPSFDLAFLEAPAHIHLAKINLGEIDTVEEGDEIIAIGHPYGLKFTATRGIVSKAKRKWNDKYYIQIDAAINPGNSGGPLINNNFKIIGVNTFIISEGSNLGFALPVNSLKQSLNDYKGFSGEYALRCSSCSNIIKTEDVQNYYCPCCGYQIHKEEIDGKKYIPSSAGKKIEEIISNLNYDVRIARIGQNFWEIEEGSAIIRINYDQETNHILAYAVLCKLPKKNIGTIYEYLLKENNYLKGLSFSVIQQDIILSMMHIYEEDLHIHTGTQLFKLLFNKADVYDDILIDMGALPLNKDDY